MMLYSLKRRWLRFSIRSLLVAVTILCAWLGWQVNLVRQRQIILDDLAASYGFKVYKASEPVIFTHRPIARIPKLREWLGDDAIDSIWFPESRDPDEYERRLFKRLFPEAELHRIPASVMERPPPA